LREDEFDGRIEADIAVDDLAALVDKRAVPHSSLKEGLPFFKPQYAAT
jgi:hypothetical protein